MRTIICENCGHTEECCVCENIERNNDTRRKLENYQEEYSLTNDEMTDFIRDNDIDY